MNPAKTDEPIETALFDEKTRVLARNRALDGTRVLQREAALWGQRFPLENSRKAENRSRLDVYVNDARHISETPINKGRAQSSRSPDATSSTQPWRCGLSLPLMWQLTYYRHRNARYRAQFSLSTIHVDRLNNFLDSFKMFVYFTCPWRAKSFSELIQQRKEKKEAICDRWNSLFEKTTSSRPTQTDDVVNPGIILALLSSAASNTMSNSTTMTSLSGVAVDFRSSDCACADSTWRESVSVLAAITQWHVSERRRFVISYTRARRRAF